MNDKDGMTEAPSPRQMERAGGEAEAGEAAARMRAFVIGAGICVAFVVGVIFVFLVERRELAFISEPQLLTPTENAQGGSEPHRELGRVRLASGEAVRLLLCSENGFQPRERWAGALDIALWEPEAQQVLLRVAMDQSLLERTAMTDHGPCVLLASGGDWQQDGEFAIEALWLGRELHREVSDSSVFVVVYATPPLLLTHRIPLIIVFLGVFWLLFEAFRRKGSPDQVEKPQIGNVLIRLGLGVGIFGVFLYLLPWAPLPGSLGGMIRGLLLASVQVGCAFVFAYGGYRLQFLAVFGPKRWVLWFVLSAVTGAVLWLVGHQIEGLFPEYEGAPIQVFVSWSSGKLAASLLGLLAPIAEEIFFRGFVYGSVERKFGVLPAIIVASILFAGAHTFQMWGAWGTLTSVFILSVGLSVLRAMSRSVLPCIVAHFAYNGTILFISALFSVG